MKYSSINMNYAEYKDINGFLFLGSFGNNEQSNSNSSRCGSGNDNETSKNDKNNQESSSKVNKSQVLFIKDGPDLVTVNMGSLSMETYQNKLSVDEQEKISIGQLNSR